MMRKLQGTVAFERVLTHTCMHFNNWQLCEVNQAGLLYLNTICYLFQSSHACPNNISCFHDHAQISLQTDFTPTFYWETPAVTGGCETASCHPFRLRVRCAEMNAIAVDVWLTMITSVCRASHDPLGETCVDWKAEMLIFRSTAEFRRDYFIMVSRLNMDSVIKWSRWVIADLPWKIQRPRAS